MFQEYYEKPPEEQLFYKVIAITLTMSGMGDYEWWGYKFPKFVHYFLYLNHYIFLTTGPFTISSQIIYLYVHFHQISFNTHGVAYSFILATIMIVAKICSAQLNSYRKVMKRFLKEIHLYNFKDQGSYMRERLIEVELYCRYPFYFYLMLLIIDWALWTLMPILNNRWNAEAIQNKTRPMQTSFYLWMPFDYEYNYENWVIVHGINSVIIALACIVLTVLDTINYTLIFHLIGHIKTFKYKVRTQFRGKLTHKEVKDRLADIIQYHVFLLQVFKDIESGFGVNISVNYLHNLIADSLLLYQMMAGEKSNRLIYGFILLVIMGGGIMMTLILEEIRKETIDISDIVYEIPWEQFSVPNQKTVILLLARTQRVLEFKAAGGLKAGVQPMLSIIKSTFSYYVMLNSSV